MHARCACSRTPGPCMNLCASVSLFQDPFHGFGNAHLLAPNTLLLVCEEPNSSITRNALRRCPRMARANIHQKAPSFLTKLRYALVYAKAYLCRGNAAPFLLIYRKREMLKVTPRAQDSGSAPCGLCSPTAEGGTGAEGLSCWFWLPVRRRCSARATWAVCWTVRWLPVWSEQEIAA